MSGQIRDAARRHRAPNPSLSPSVPLATSTTMTPCRKALATTEIATGTSMSSRNPPTVPERMASVSAAVAFSSRENVTIMNGTNTAAVAIAETSCTTRPLPNVAAGLRRSVRNGAQSSVPNPSGRRGSRPGFGGGVQPPGAGGGGRYAPGSAVGGGAYGASVALGRCVAPPGACQS